MPILTLHRRHRRPGSARLRPAHDPDRHDPHRVGRAAGPGGGVVPPSCSVRGSTAARRSASRSSWAGCWPSWCCISVGPIPLGDEVRGRSPSAGPRPPPGAHGPAPRGRARRQPRRGRRERTPPRRRPPARAPARAGPRQALLGLRDAVAPRPARPAGTSPSRPPARRRRPVGARRPPRLQVPRAPRPARRRPLAARGPGPRTSAASRTSPLRLCLARSTCCRWRPPAGP